MGAGEGAKQMKTTIKTTVTEEVELTLPYFFKTAAHHVAIISETEAIKITIFMGFEIALKNSSEKTLQEFAGLEKTEITQDEFIETYELSLSEINKSKSKLLQ